MTNNENGNSQNAESASAGPPKNPPDIATTAELEKLKAERRQPKLELHHTPGGTIEKNVHTNVDEQREARIKNLEERLGSAQKKFESNFHDSARKSIKDDFNRSSKGRSR